MNEFELIGQLIPGLAANRTVVVGAGDDCAVIDLGSPGEYLLFKTDAIVEGIHFKANTEPERIGHKALGRCLSDVAAMGGKPTNALITLALPATFSPEKVSRIYAGLNALAKQFQVAVVGGETVLNPERILISVSLLGVISQGKEILRSGARVGDAILVSGELGGSRLGRHLDFMPRVQQGQWLAANFAVHAMIDLSDGLAGDIRHILTASGFGAELEAAAIPISPAAKVEPTSALVKKSPLKAALTDGEDFELLFTLESAQVATLQEKWLARFPEVPVSCIGIITRDQGVRLRQNDTVSPLEDYGYSHFS
jgi:thiamine-monophosphate kinase